MNWRSVRVLSLFDLRLMMRRRETLFWMFLMPVLFMVLIGKMTEESGGGGAEPVIGVWDRDQGPLADAFLARVDSLGYEIARVGADSALAGYRRQIRIPEGFTSGALRGVEQKVLWHRTGDASEGSMLDKVQVQRALLQTLGDLLTVEAEGSLGTGDRSPGSAEPDDSSLGSVATADSSQLVQALAEVRGRPRSIELDVTSAGSRQVSPDGFQQSVPGILVMFVVLVLLTTGGVLLVLEREEGLLRRLASAPVARGEIILSKLIARVAIGFVQVVFALGVGTVLRVDWGGRIPEILVLLGVYGIAISSLSLLFGNLARSRGQAVGFGVLAANLLGALGGCWWPIEVVSGTLQRLAWFLPTGWAMYGMHRLMNFGAGWEGIAVPLALLAGSAVVFLYLAQRTFRYQ